MLAPFALAYQGSGADWTDPTYVDFWTGLPLLVISVVGLILYASELVEELRRRCIMHRPYAAPLGQPQARPKATLRARRTTKSRYCYLW
jgi:hypothetical protein